ncbi:Prefoldin subunit 1 [Trichoplax sp. H2]|uniref:Prefoldin subunit 1 n=1 Tax=Trichoplax adhaerens TaxID=10228 RepID=B3S4N6_TRIAD|nr:hypothetical protein TRIADDRAFT_59152 [Trichoplax adhaerens]EDV22499.1 hypothetical protein TRIADDRAFT_59152 [Trichoplax adhaerens]RDD36826.1 Prefoldin subunit 1 [Trichoplax sp. H2]|eukprot:XP_002115043.1 hypothetical protein TRIADDRAFT_59152 [Trichoplax adhaerens]
MYDQLDVAIESALHIIVRYNVGSTRQLLTVWLFSKAFHELQVKVIDTTQQVKVTEAKIDQLKRGITRARLTDQELSNIPKGIKTYENLGRIFVSQSIEDIRKSLAERINAANDKIEKLNAS